jgi:hypothetical protein
MRPFFRENETPEKWLSLIRAFDPSRSLLGPTGFLSDSVFPFLPECPFCF